MLHMNVLQPNVTLAWTVTQCALGCVTFTQKDSSRHAAVSVSARGGAGGFCTGGGIAG